LAVTGGIVLRFRRPVNQGRIGNDAVWQAFAKVNLIDLATSRDDALWFASPHKPRRASAKKKGGPFGRLFLVAHGLIY
jgi:hypothetical protein